MRPGPLSPWWIVGAFAAVAVGAAVGIPEPLAAAGLGVVLLGATARHPANGLAAVVLTSPLLLGEHKTPYFLLAHVLALAVGLSWIVHRALGRLPGSRLRLGAGLCFVAAAVLAVPLNLRDLLEDLWLARWLDWSAILSQGIPDISHLKYLDRVGVVTLGVTLFAVASQAATLPTTVGALTPLVALVGALSMFGLLRFFGVVRTAGQYLTLSFWTWEHPDLRLTATAWNPDYFAQCLVLVVPLALSLGWGRGGRWQRALGWAAGGAGTLALVFTFQRAAYASLVVALATLALFRWRSRSRGDTSRFAAAGIGGAVLVLSVILLDRVVLHGRVTGRLAGFATDPTRIQLWTVALQMLRDHPLLGVGSGRYTFFFREYVHFHGLGYLGRFIGTAHSTYVQLLAEQGVIGLASFLAFFGGVWLAGFRRMGDLAADGRSAAEGLLASFAGWFAYAAVQYVFRVDALTYLACVLAGMVVALTPPPAVSRGGSPRWWLAAAALGLLVLGVRVETALRRPVTPGYEAGFYRWERQADGTPARWAGGRAAMTPRVEGSVMVLRLAAPLPGIEGRPQTVRVWIDRTPVTTVRLTSPDWQEVWVPVGRPPSGHVLVELEAGETVIPSRDMASRDRRTLGVMVGEIRWRDE